MTKPGGFLGLIFRTPQACAFQELGHHRRQLAERHGFDVLAVHPKRLRVGPIARITLLEIEDGRGLIDLFQREFLYEQAPREKLLIVARRPAKEREKVHEGVSYKSSIAVGRHGYDLPVLAFREFFAPRRKDQRQVRKYWKLRA